jgi:beta-N-acetylhexosaminidase
MNALKFSLKENIIRSFDAGCNLILHCNGNIKEMYRVSRIIPYADKFVNKKTSQFSNFLR